MLMLGVFLGAWSVAWLWYSQDWNSWRRLVLSTGIAIGAFVAFYVAFWAATGFNPIATFNTALANQRVILVLVHRPWPLTVPWDMYDVVLGTGWISLWLMICYFTGRRQFPGERIGRESNRTIPQPVLCAICLLQPIVIAVLHILPGEAARLYAFMFPLMLVPVGLEMSEWPRKYRVIICACLWLLGAATLRNMEFIQYDRITGI
jgi:hypothetical protein